MENINENIPQEKPLSKKEEKKAKKQAKKDAKKARQEAKKQAKAAKKENRKKLSKADVKGIFLIIVLIAVAAVLLSVCIKASEEGEITADVSINTTTQATVQTTVPPTAAPTEAPVTVPIVTEATTVAQTVTAPAATEKETTKGQEQTTTKPAEVTTSQPAATNPATLTDKEVLDIVTKGVNSLQSDTASYTGKQTQVIYIQLNDCSVPFMTGTINKVLEFFAGEEVFDYDFTNGKAMDPEEGVEVHAIHVFPPTDRLFTLSIEGVASTSVTKNEKGTVYTVKLVPETATLENARPPHHNSASDVLDFSAFELPMGQVTKADFNYPGATISVTLDGNGKVVEYHERLDMSGFGEGEILGITGSGDMEGYIDEHWSIQWK